MNQTLNSEPPGREGLERDAMAWPPAAWERPVGVWRTDIEFGAEPFVPNETLRQPARRRRPLTSVAPLAREVLETVILTALMFVGIRLLVQNFRIEGRSMEPTLYTKQYLLVNKLAYKLLGQPQRGDIVVFEAWGEEKDFIKRVIGRPGDEIEIRDNHVRVNGVVLEEPYLEGAGTSDQMDPRLLGENEYWVMGDNRRNSADSRAYGPLPAEKIIGKAWMTYWPPSSFGPIPSGATSFASSP